MEVNNSYQENDNRLNNLTLELSPELTNKYSNKSRFDHEGKQNMSENAGKSEKYAYENHSEKKCYKYYNQRSYNPVFESSCSQNVTRYNNNNKEGNQNRCVTREKGKESQYYERFKKSQNVKVYEDGVENHRKDRNRNFSNFERNHINKNWQYSKQQDVREQEFKMQRGGYKNSHQTLQSRKQYFWRDGKEMKYFDEKKMYNSKNINDQTVDLNQRESLIWQLNNNKYECMICFTNISAECSTWPCDNCYHIFHLKCINKWAGKCESEADKNSNKMSFRCPTCQMEYSDTNSCKSMPYRCFCGKSIDPLFKRTTLPHSCGEVCEKFIRKPNGDKCIHLCSLLCHPGPCPPCEAIIKRKCHCGSTNISTKCTSDPRTFVCGSKCDKLLNCNKHKCQELCHMGSCNPCTVTIDQKCPCENNTVRVAVCGTTEAYSKFTCGSRCGKSLQCGNHKCDQPCHFESCQPCELSPEFVLACWCGKYSINELLNDKTRQSCLDPVPKCNEICGKSIHQCGHTCTRLCHSGICEPCPLSKDVLCSCGKSIIEGVLCSENTNRTCLKVCNKKLSCGRHRCIVRCCNDDVHSCLELCGRKLSCKSHTCERECGHSGVCPTCSNVSFDEMYCECGSAVALPPIACGQSAPVCKKLCTRNHDCNHTVRHNCHSSEKCPPCTELTSKPCPGGHRILDNIPCFRMVVTCGLACDRPLSNCDHLCKRICHDDICVNSDNIKCVQPCNRVRGACQHPCSAPCHEKEISCESVMVQCDFRVTLSCKCGLRCSTFACSDLTSLTTNSFDNIITNVKIDLISESTELKDSEEGMWLKCNEGCEKAIKMATKMQRVFLPSSYNIIQKYYASYFEDFCRNNFKFVVEVEKIFSKLIQSLVTAHPDHDEGSKNIDRSTVYKFSSISIGNSKFIDRLCSTYKIVSRVVYDFEAKSANVTVEAVRNQSIIPRSVLSKMVENKYFKFFKPAF